MDVPAEAPLPKLFATQAASHADGGGEAVSIIMRTKSRALLLPRALNSVLAQSFTDWRLYLVNDGGDAAALEAVVAPFRAALGERLHIIHHPASRGMEAASNAGLSAGAGRYFAIHDDDDRWHPDFLSRTVAFLEEAGNAAYIGVAVHCEVVQERIEGGSIVTAAQFPWAYFRPPVEYAAMLARNQIPPIALLLRRSLLARMGGYNEKLPVLGDWEFALRALAVGDIGALAEPLAFYHHRLAADHAIYANSVSGGVDIHRETRARMGNHIIRTALKANPALLGTLWPVLQAIEAEAEGRRALEARMERLNQEIMARFTALETHVRAIREGTGVQRILFAPLHYLRRRLRRGPAR